MTKRALKRLYNNLNLISQVARHTLENKEREEEISSLVRQLENKEVILKTTLAKRHEALTISLLYHSSANTVLRQVVFHVKPTFVVCCSTATLASGLLIYT